MINLKKLFASVMALALVGAVAPAKTVNAANYCTDEVMLNYVEVLTVLEDADLDIDTMKLTDYVDEEETTTVADYLGEPDVIAAITNFNACNIPDDEEATKLGNLVAYVGALETAIATLEEKLIEKNAEYLTIAPELDDEDDLVYTVAEADGEWYEFIEEADIAEAKELYATLTAEKYEDYIENIADTHIEALDAYLEVLEERIAEYNEDHYDETVEAYIEALEKVVLYGDETVADFIEAKGAVSYKELTTFKKAVAKIEADKAETNEGTKLVTIADFDDMVEEDEVAEIMDALAEAIEGMEEVKGLVSTKNAALKAFNKIGGQAIIDDLAEAAGNNAIEVEERVDDFYEVLADVTTAEIETIVEYYEEVVSNFYVITTKERANGTYTVSNAATALTKYLAGTENYDEVFVGLAKLIDRTEDETTYFDEMAALPETVEEALDAISTELKGVTVKNLNTKNAQKVVDAYEALGELNTTYAGNLTKAQQKVVDANETNITTLRTYMLFNGIQTVEPNGWVELGNGNWDYYVEGVAFTGWVAAGSNWYYVSNGHMLRNTWVAKDATGAVWYYLGADGAMVSNTVVDGYAINANGEWVK